MGRFPAAAGRKTFNAVDEMGLAWCTTASNSRGAVNGLGAPILHGEASRAEIFCKRGLTGHEPDGPPGGAAGRIETHARDETRHCSMKTCGTWKLRVSRVRRKQRRARGARDRASADGG